MDGDPGRFPSPVRIALLLGLAAGGLVVVGSITTWAEAQVPLLGPVSVNGFDNERNGAATLVLDLGIAAVGASAAWGRWLVWRGALAALLGVLAIGLALEEAGDLRDIDHRTRLFGHRVIDTHLTLGLPFIVAGGMLATASGAVTAALAFGALRTRH